MRTIPQPFFEAFRQALAALLDRDGLETFSVSQFGPAEGFLSSVGNGAYPDQLVEYLSVLSRRGKLIAAAREFLEAQDALGNRREEVTQLRQQLAATFTVDEVTGKVGLSKKQFDLVSIGPGMPFVGRDKFRKHLRQLLSGKDNVHNVLGLIGGVRCGQSYLGVYLAEIGRKLGIYNIISIDFKRDLPVGPGEQITDVHLADTISRRMDGLEEYQDMYRDRPDDFKLSSFTQSLIYQLKASEKIHLFFFDHLNYVPLTNSVQAMIVDLANKIAKRETPGVVVTSGLVLRPGDYIFGDLHWVTLGNFTQRQVVIYFNYLYDSISTPEARSDVDAKKEFLRGTMKAFPDDFFADPTQATVVEIAKRCRTVTRIVLANSEPAVEDVEDGLILDY